MSEGSSGRIPHAPPSPPGPRRGRVRDRDHRYMSVSESEEYRNGCMMNESPAPSCMSRSMCLS
eukprot:scaffold27257_cov129-Isochrysis_galbana.AAC.2